MFDKYLVYFFKIILFWVPTDMLLEVTRNRKEIISLIHLDEHDLIEMSKSEEIEG